MARDVAVVSFAELPAVRREWSATRSRCWSRCIGEAIERSGIGRREIGFTVSGSCDYLDGAALLVRDGARRGGRLAPHRGVARRDGRRLGALRGVGPAPARRRRHGARLRVRPLVAGRDRATCSPCSSTPTTSRRSGPTPSASPPSRRGPCSTRAAPPSERWPRSPRGTASAPAQNGGPDRERLRRRGAARRAVRGGAAPAARLPAHLGRRLRVVLAAGDRARKACARPAWIRGIDHRIEPHSLGRARPHPLALDHARGRERRACSKGAVDVAEIHAPFSHQEIIVREALGLGCWRVDVNPSGGALAANPFMVAGLTRIGAAARRVIDGQRAPRRRPRHGGPCLQQNLVCVLEGGA